MIIKRSDKEIVHPGKWALPGGKVEPNSSVFETLKREVMEEVGLEVKNTSLLSDFEFTRPDNLHVVGLTFLCSVKKPNVVLDSKDFSDYAWIEAKDMNKYDLVNGVKRDLELAFKAGSNIVQ